MLGRYPCSNGANKQSNRSRISISTLPITAYGLLVRKSPHEGIKLACRDCTCTLQVHNTSAILCASKCMAIKYRFVQDTRRRH
jgi:hypothetical protein